MTTQADQHFERAMGELSALKAEADSLRRQLERAHAERDLIYCDIAALGVALGHPDTARPESPQVVFTRWVEEVAELKARMDGLEK